jgi:putative copper resistance protein D
VRFFYLFSVWLHLIAAMVWIGGMVFLAAVVVPVLRRPEHRALLIPLISQTGKRFRWVGWVCLGVLVATGIFNLTSHGFGWEQVWSGRLFMGGFGQTLEIKLVLVGVVLILSVIHDFFVGPRATAVGQSAPGSAEAIRLRRQASWIGRVNLLISLIIVALGVLLVRG